MIYKNAPKIERFYSAPWERLGEATEFLPFGEVRRDFSYA